MDFFFKIFHQHKNVHKKNRQFAFLVAKEYLCDPRSHLISTDNTPRDIYINIIYKEFCFQ